MGYIKLDKKAFFHNLDYFGKICTKDKLSIALKDNAYGHGTLQAASMCEEYGIRHVFVRDMNEARIIKEFNFETILVLYDIPKEYDDKVIVSINNLDHIDLVPKGSKCELKIDTGMNRNGVTPKDIEKALGKIKQNNLILNGVFTHFCCADEDNKITKIQENIFLEAVDKVKKYITYSFRIHCANSAGVHKVNMDRYDLARIGIGAYGYLDIEEDKYLKPVMSLHAKKIATKFIKQGEHVGYGSKAFIAQKDMNVSNYDIGYGDGFYRFSEQKKGFVSSGLPILGRVSMDSFSVESTDDSICVFRDVKELAKVQETITYTILTNMKNTIKREIE
ncbi:MAG: alanine racemase [Campylobacterota bacterium]|nr:alanine racemase [Campylobacterota bacterium]